MRFILYNAFYYVASTASETSLLSIVIPTLNESKSAYLPKILARYQPLLAIQQIEIICVDGGSKDNTKAIIQDAGVCLVNTNIASRAGRLNKGIELAKFSMVLLHHPRSIIEEAGLLALIEQADHLRWGAFTHQFDMNHSALSFTSWYSNYIRGDKRGIYYLDHCIFVQKSLLLEVNLLPDIEIFEDTEICVRLKKKAKAVRLPFISQTSAVRFQTNGIIKQALKNQYMKWCYYFRRSDKKMNKAYEKGIALNTEYDDE